MRATGVLGSSRRASPRYKGPMNLAHILEACQADRLDDWRVIPGGDVPDTNLLAAVFDAGDQTGPALTALPHLYRAVYVPDARLGLGWGMDLEDSRHREPRTKPDWANPRWRGAEPKYAHVLLNGTMVWRVLYTWANWGAGISGILPYPSRKFEEGPDYPLDVLPGGWDTTRWEVEFTRLLNDLNENDQFRFDDELSGWGLKILEVSPLELTRPGGPRDD
jgi:hypothetical protein